MAPIVNIKSREGGIKLGKTKKETLVIAMFILGAVVAAYFFLFFKPSLGELTKILPQIKSLSVKLQDTRFAISRRAVLEEKEATLREKIDYYEEKLPNQKEIPKLLEHLSDIAIQSDVKIIGIKPAGIPSGAIYRENPINFEAACGYHQLGEFIQKLETADRFMKISDIFISSGQASITKHITKLAITTYTLPKE